MKKLSFLILAAIMITLCRDQPSWPIPWTRSRRGASLYAA